MNEVAASSPAADITSALPDLSMLSIDLLTGGPECAFAQAIRAAIGQDDDEQKLTAGFSNFV